MPVYDVGLSVSWRAIQFLIFYLNTSHLQCKASLQFRKGQELTHWSPPTTARPPLPSLLTASTLFSRKDKRRASGTLFLLHPGSSTSETLPLSPGPKRSQSFSGKSWKMAPPQARNPKVEGGFTLGGLAVVPLPISHPGCLLHKSNSGTKDLGREGRGRQSSKKKTNLFKKIFFLFFLEWKWQPVYYSKMAFY